jgi:hypothetical protein
MISVSVASDAKYSSRQAAEVLGVPFQGLDRILRQLGFEPTVASRGSGKPRRWTLADIVALKIGRSWLERGIAWPVVHQGVHWLRAEGMENVATRPIVVVCGDEIWAASQDSLATASLRAEPEPPGQDAANRQPEHAMVCDLRSCIAQVKHDLSRVRHLAPAGNGRAPKVEPGPNNGPGAPLPGKDA